MGDTLDLAPVRLRGATGGTLAPMIGCALGLPDLLLLTDRLPIGCALDSAADRLRLRFG